MRTISHLTYFKPVIKEQSTILDTRWVQFANNSPNSQDSNRNKIKRTVKESVTLGYLNESH